ncbi:MAG TPA: hypothetical protein DEF01_03855 [Gemmatimonadetes bacterium]|nr:hypothetical protein [Gemmatimonadota bacterium]
MMLSFIGRRSQMKIQIRKRAAPILSQRRCSGLVGLTQAVFLGLTVSLSACADTPDVRSSSESSSAVGRTPTRIVSLVPSLTELVIAIGMDQLLVARTDYDTHPRVVDLPSVGGGLDPSLEDLIELNIDMVLMPESRDMPALAARLNDLGILTVRFPIETVADLYYSIEKLGDLLGQKDAADELATEISSGLDQVSMRVAGEARVRTMYVIWTDPPMTTSSGSYIDEVISIAGGQNVFSDAPVKWPSVGYESIVERNPSILVWPRSEGSKLTINDIQGLPGWRDLDAVRNGRIIFVDADRFNRPGPELPNVALELARALHPAAFRKTGL